MGRGLGLVLLLGLVGCVDVVGPWEPGPNPPPSYALVYEGRPDGAPELLRIALDGASGPTRILPEGTIGRAPTVSPDGKWIAFVAWDGEGISHIYRVRRDGTGLSMLTDSGEDDDQPSWSPDGSRIAFRSFRAQAGGEIWVMQADGRSARRVAGSDPGTGIDHGRPAWSPDGQRLAFTSDRGGDYGIWTVRVDGTDLHQLTNTPDYDTEPNWSPDGQTIAFRRSWPQTGSDIWFIPAQGGVAWPLVMLGEQRMPVWSPDGTRIAFVTYDAPFSTGRIATMRPDGRDVVLHTADGRWGGIAPAWQRLE